MLPVNPMMLTKKFLKLEIMENVTKKLLVKQKVQDALKKFQDTTNKELEKTKK
jgi:hypothetical protein